MYYSMNVYANMLLHRSPTSQYLHKYYIGSEQKHSDW